MNESEKKFNELKKDMKAFNILSAVCLVIALAGGVLTIVGSVLKKSNQSLSNILFFAGIGAFAAALVFILSIVFVSRSKQNEYNKAKIEAKK